MNVIDKIRAEIERLKGICTAQIKANPGQTFPFVMEMTGYDKLLSFLDTLEEPEQPTMGYDEAYLNEKIAKASKSWEGVDVDKFMDEIRGREPVSEDLEDEMDRYFESMEVQEHENIFEDTFHRIAKHFAEWGAEHLADASKMISGDLEKKTFDDYLKASPAERRKMNMAEILGEERLAKTKEQMDLEEAGGRGCEKTLFMKLTAEDIKRIDIISCEVANDFAKEGFKKPWNGEDFYEEVARRFNDEK